MEDLASPRSDKRLVRWAVVAAILGAAAIVATTLILRAVPREVEVEVEIAGWRVPVGLVVSSGDLRSRLPGLVVGSLLGDESAIQINAGQIERIEPGELTIQPLTGGRSVTYELTDSTKSVNVRNFLLGAPLEEGELAAVITSPGSKKALLVLMGITNASD